MAALCNEHCSPVPLGKLCHLCGSVTAVGEQWWADGRVPDWSSLPVDACSEFVSSSWDLWM